MMRAIYVLLVIRQHTTVIVEMDGFAKEGIT